MLTVEDCILLGYCEQCDLDPACCYNKGFCEYEQDAEDDDE